LAQAILAQAICALSLLRCLLPIFPPRIVAAMASLNAGVLSATLDGICMAKVSRREAFLLLRHAVETFVHHSAFPTSAASSASHPASSPIIELDKVYSVLTSVAGIRIARPTAAHAFIKAMGLNDFGKRFSSLTTRRHQAAHPDGNFADDLADAIHSMEPERLADLAEQFRKQANTNSKDIHQEALPGGSVHCKLVEAPTTSGSPATVSVQGFSEDIADLKQSLSLKFDSIADTTNSMTEALNKMTDSVASLRVVLAGVPADGLQNTLFHAELDALFRRTLPDVGYEGLQIHVTPTRTEIIIRAARTREANGDRGCRIQAIKTEVDKRFGFSEGAAALFVERC
jgi:hypothetical protein